MKAVKVEFTLANGEKLTFENKDNGKGYQIEFNVFVSPLHTTNNNSWIKISNPEFKYLASNYPLKNSRVVIYGGMLKGFPWITPTYGMIAEGMVWYDAPNTEGTQNYIYVNLVNQSSYMGVNSVELLNKNMSPYYRLDWDNKTELKDALFNCLKRFHPVQKIDIQIKTGYLGEQYNNSLPFADLQTLAAQVFRLSNYKILMTVDNGIIVVRDGSNVSKPTLTINLQDVIGQPNIIDTAGSISIRTHLNGKVSWNDIVSIPSNLIAKVSPDAAIAKRNRLNFTGTYQIIGIQQFCSIRSKNAEDFSTVLTLQPYAHQ